MRLFLVRHGETNWNREGRIQGQQDTPLNLRGLEQARRVAERLRGHPFALVVSSPLSRALQTARAIHGASDSPVPLQVDEGLTEIHHGDWEGRLAQEVRATWPSLLDRWHERPEEVRMPGPGGETLEEVRDRAVAAAERLAATCPVEGDLCLASHDAVLKVLLCHWMGAPLGSFWRFVIPNGGLNLVELRAGKPPRLLLLGDASHLEEGFHREEQKGL